MGATKITTADICLDEHGRAVLSNDVLDALSQHDLSLPLAGGTNASCNNNGCTNDGCSSTSQTNTSCTNLACEGPLNSNCTNKVSEY